MMRNQFFLAMVMASGLVCAAGCDRNPTTSTNTTDTPPAKVDTASPKPDNTTVNKADRDMNAKTPGDQAENSTDIKITADIRRAVMNDKGMSVNAQNCKIITDKGIVTLRGVVDTAAEKAAIEAKAAGISGVTRVDNQLQVKNP